MVRLLGMQLDGEKMILKPFKTIDFAFHHVVLAGVPLTVKVQAGWKRARVNGKEVELPVRLSRAGRNYVVEFIK